VSKLSPSGFDSCQPRKIVRFVGALLLLAGCSEPKKPNYTRTQPDGELPSLQHKPIESTRTNRGETRVDATIQEPQPLTGVVDIKTWADEVIRGRVVSETADAYVLDVGPTDGSQPKIRRVPRSAVMEFKNAR
jgi:hypothetical protein